VTARLQKAEIKMKSLQDSLDAKEKENKELLAICDDLISKLDDKVKLHR
jgi:hypothetical protein